MYRMERVWVSHKVKSKPVKEAVSTLPID
eukprot:SAG25_NODE_9477_length_371_cov_0.613971_1_plen_29_part_01